MKFNCPNCSQKLGVETIHSGQVVSCPGCGQEITIPSAEELLEQSSDPTSYQVDLQKPEEINAQPFDSAQGRHPTSNAQRPSEEPHQITSYQVDFSDPDSLPPEKKAQLTKIKQTVQSQIDRGSMTITQFMEQQDLEGGVDLQGTDSSTASQVITSEQGRRYKIGEVVTAGGMGAILDAKDTNLRRGVAMKVLLDPNQATKEDILRFIEEAQVTSQLEHPSIVPIHELGVDASGNVFYTMKFIHGVTLKDILKKLKKGDQKTIKEYPLVRLLTIFQRVCDAIAFAHSKHVIHRDLKPENIMIGEYGEVQVMDWGIAKVLPKKKGKHLVVKGSKAEEAQKKQSQRMVIDSVREQSGDVLKTVAGSIMGTPGFMASEQALGQTDQIDERTDIYALGAILYNILTLHPPVTGKDLGELLKKVTTGKIVHPSQYNPSTKSRKKSARPVRPKVSSVTLHHCPGKMIPDSLSAVCMKALSLRQVDRYQSVKRLQKDIEAYQGGFATSAEHAGLGRHIKLFFVRHRVVASLTAVAVVSLIAGSIISTMQWIKADRSFKALKRTAPDLAESAQRFLENGKPEEALQRIAFATQLNPGNSEYWYRKGNILQVLLRLAEAEKAYRIALRLNAEHELASKNAAICKKILAGSGGGNTATVPVSAMCELYTAMREQKRFSEALATARRRMGKEAKSLEGLLKSLLAEAGVEFRSLTVDQKRGTCSLVYPELADLSPLRGMPLADLQLNRSPVKDLSPLKDLPLTSLSICTAHVSDLSPLTSMPLRSLVLDHVPVTDLSPLRNMRLTRLVLHSIKATDITPLTGMELTSLSLKACYVRDLSPLTHMPLRHLDLERTQVTDISPLRGMPLMSLSLSGTKITDLSPLKGMRLTSLALSHTKVSDLTPLAGMPLETLMLDGCDHITSISALRGMKLRSLLLTRQKSPKPPPIQDLSPLKDMPTLQSLHDMYSHFDPAPILLKPINEALSAKVYAKAEQEVKKVIEDWSDVPAMKGVVEQAQGLEEEIPIFLALQKNPKTIPPQAKKFNGHHYLLITVPMNWNDAKKFCESVGGHLVTITSKEEDQFVASLVAEGNVSVRLGGTDIAEEGKWVWITGEPFEYQNWNQNEPGGGTKQNCLHIPASSDGKWHDGPGTPTLATIIEWDR